MASNNTTDPANLVENMKRRATDNADHPPHYGGEENPYEAIKVIEAHDLNFNRGNVVKYVLRAGKKPGESPLEDLQKAAKYLEFEIARVQRMELAKKVSDMPDTGVPCFVCGYSKSHAIHSAPGAHAYVPIY